MATTKTAEPVWTSDPTYRFPLKDLPYVLGSSNPDPALDDWCMLYLYDELLYIGE